MDLSNKMPGMASKLVPITFAEAISLTIGRTHDWALESGYVEKEPEEKAIEDVCLGPVAKALADIINDPMQTHRHHLSQEKKDSLALMCSLVLKEDIPVSPEHNEDDEDVNLHLMIMVVPTKNTNNHDYPLHHPCLIVESDDGDNDIAMMQDGTLGNHLDREFSSIRPATPAEIQSFFEGLPDELECQLRF